MGSNTYKCNRIRIHYEVMNTNTNTPFKNVFEYEVHQPIKINNSRPKFLLFISILLETEKNKKKRKTIWDFFTNLCDYDMYSKCIQKVFMKTGLLKKYLNTI